MANWDHLGQHDGEAGDNIYNGAVDNATGVAGNLEVA
jgi:Zn-dependent M28 family amino/carboxypeptidase